MESIEHITYFEKVLLFLGIGLFVVLVIGLIYYMVKGRDFKPFLLFFLLPIAMIAYPSIREIQYEGLILKLKESQQELIANPMDSVARQEVATLTKKIIPRAKSAEVFNQISLSNVLLEDAGQAEVFANKALVKDPENKEATDLKKVAQIQMDFKTNREATTTDSTEKAKLKNLRLSPQTQKLKPYILKQEQIRRSGN